MRIWEDWQDANESGSLVRRGEGGWRQRGAAGMAARSRRERTHRHAAPAPPAQQAWHAARNKGMTILRMGTMRRAGPSRLTSMPDRMSSTASRIVSPRGALEPGSVLQGREAGRGGLVGCEETPARARLPASCAIACPACGQARVGLPARRRCNPAAAGPGRHGTAHKPMQRLWPR